MVVWAGGLEPPRVHPSDFLTTMAFATHPKEVVCGLDYPFIIMLSHLRCCPSSLYTFRLLGLARDCHFKGFPEFEQFYAESFPPGTPKKSLPSTIPARPHRQFHFSHKNGAQAKVKLNPAIYSPIHCPLGQRRPVIRLICHSIWLRR